MSVLKFKKVLKKILKFSMALREQNYMSLSNRGRSSDFVTKVGKTWSKRVGKGKGEFF